MSGAPIRYRLGLNQPAHSPTAQRLAQMAQAIERDTQGSFCLAVCPESTLGPDPQMFADLQAGTLEFYLSGATLGGVAPTSALALLPYAFSSSEAVFAALDGGLGTLIRRELSMAGMHTFRYWFQNGFHHITTAGRAIEGAADFAGLKIRSPGGAIAADFFRALGAEAGMVPFSQMYEALKERQFDGQSDPHQVALALRLYEVQTHLSLTGHWWSGFTLLANAAAWAWLPADIQWVVERNVEAAAKRQRADIEQVNAAGEAALAAHGMTIARPDTAGIRARLGLLYARWRTKFPAATWRTLESYADGLG